MKGAKQSMIAISLINLMVMVNPALVPSGSAYKTLWWFSIIMFSFRIIVDAARSGYLSHPVLPSLMLYSLIVLFISTFSLNISVSIAKIFSFSLMATALLLGFRMTLSQYFDWQSWFLASWFSVFILSVPTLFLTDIGYYRDQNGFQGILNHPQVYGIYMSTACAWMFINTFFSNQTSKTSSKIYVMALIWFMLLTKARTAIVAISISFLFIFVISIIFKIPWTRYLKRMIYAFAVISLTLFILTYFSNTSRELISDFFLKKNEAGSVNQAYSASRGQIVEESWTNFLEQPIYGIGFGMTKNENIVYEIDTRTGLPLSFTTEKAMMPVVLLEETGLVGFFAFIPFFLMMIRYAITSFEIKMPMLFLTALFINIGEMVFFSIGGIGLYLLMIVFWAVNSRYTKEIQ
jgi:O-antigen ligase